MFPFTITVLNSTDKRFNNSRIENINKLLGVNVKKVKDYNILWESEDTVVNIFPNMIRIEFVNVSVLNKVKRLINILEYRNIVYIECTYKRLVTGNNVDEYIKNINTLVKVNNFSDTINKAVVVKLEFVSIIDELPYLIAFSLEQSDFKAKIQYVLKCR
jgi:hypothetical protein